jgi:hypothetical protein
MKMLTVADFNPVDMHPYGILEGHLYAFEKEQMLAFMLNKALEAGDLYIVVPTSNDHSQMVDYDLLEKVSERHYRLTTKAIGLLYSFYGKGSHANVDAESKTSV